MSKAPFMWVVCLACSSFSDYVFGQSFGFVASICFNINFFVFVSREFII